MFMTYRATIHDPENFTKTTYVEGITFGDSLKEGISKVEAFYADLLKQVSIRFIDENEDEDGVIEFSTIEEGMSVLYGLDVDYVKESFGLTDKNDDYSLEMKLKCQM